MGDKIAEGGRNGLRPGFQGIVMYYAQNRDIPTAVKEHLLNAYLAWEQTPQSILRQYDNAVRQCDEHTKGQLLIGYLACEQTPQSRLQQFNDAIRQCDEHTKVNVKQINYDMNPLSVREFESRVRSYM